MNGRPVQIVKINDEDAEHSFTLGNYSFPCERMGSETIKIFNFLEQDFWDSKMSPRIGSILESELWTHPPNAPRPPCVKNVQKKISFLVV